jgi:mRNA interferase RelE/StbE
LTHRIEFRPAARRDIAKLDRSIASKVVADIEKLAESPRPHGVEKLAGEDKLYRVRVGPGKNYRAVYQIRDESLLVLVVKVGDRKDVYRDL